MFENLIGFWTLVRRELNRTKRVIGQAIVAPLITAFLYLFVFGYVVGTAVPSMQGMPYMSFIFPGVIAMNLILTVFSTTSFSAYMMKFQKILDDVLTLPLSYTEVVLSMLVSGLIRGLVIVGVLAALALTFGVNTVVHPWFLLFWTMLLSVLFGLMGVVVGIWADNSFEKLALAGTFILTPLSFIGGAFYSASSVPEKLQFIIHFNPIYYAIDGIRYGFTGYHEASMLTSFLVIGALTAIVFTISVWIFRTGWKLRS